MDLQTFIASEAGLALKGALVAAFLDFATGSFAAIRDGTFQFDAVAAFLRKHVMGRVVPLGTLLVVGYYSGDQGALILPFAIAGLIAYAAETIASVKDNLIPPTGGDEPAEKNPANPVPTD